MLLFSLVAVLVSCNVPVQCAVVSRTAAAASTGSPMRTTNAKFVQKLKEDLRRNNDDYILGRNLTEPETEKESSDHSSASVDDIEEVYRRALVERGTERLTIRKKNKRPLPIFRSANNMIKETNAKVAGKAGMAGIGRAQADKDANDGKHFFRARDLNDNHILSPDQLDMAPARGRKITLIRNKGRMCQRHVLIPEGPKYDSQGRVYLRAHPPHAARPYGRTRSPALILPRCCNCCKKSVLGCE